MNEIKQPLSRRESASVPMSGMIVVWDGIAGFVKRRRRIMFGTMLAVFVAGLGLLLLVPWSYRATAVVAINANPAIPENPQMNAPTPPAERMQREIQGLQSRALAAAVIDKLKLDREPEFNPDLQAPGFIDRLAGSVALLVSVLRRDSGPSKAEIDELRRGATVDLFIEKLRVTPVLTADLIQVSFASRDPRIAYQVANAVVDTYIQTAASARGTALQTAADALQERISAVRDELRDLPSGVGALSNLERQLEARRTLLQVYIAKLGELLLLKAAIEPRVFIQSRAVYPMKRAGVPLAMGIPLILIAGLFLGIGLALVMEARERTFSSAAQLQSMFRLPLLGAGMGRLRDVNLADATVTPDPARLARACERIALEILMARPAERPVTVAVTGASADEAQSAVSIGVARALARTEHRTLLVDTGIVPSTRRARIAAKSIPCADVIDNADGGSVELRQDAASALEILAVNLDRESTAGAYERAAKTISQAASRYTFLVVDVPPVGASAEARFLARQADIAIVVVRRGHDTREGLSATIERLQADGVRVLGIVFTKGKFERGLLGRTADLLRIAS